MKHPYPYTRIGLWMIFLIPGGLATIGFLYACYQLMGTQGFLIMMAMVLWFAIGGWFLKKGNFQR